MKTKYTITSRIPNTNSTPNRNSSSESKFVTSGMTLKPSIKQNARGYSQMLPHNTRKCKNLLQSIFGQLNSERQTFLFSFLVTLLEKHHAQPRLSGYLYLAKHIFRPCIRIINFREGKKINVSNCPRQKLASVGKWLYHYPTNQPTK